jgi:hypothetical protein
MSQAISPGLIPPRPGLEREEPEIASEDDIPPAEGNNAAMPPQETPAEGGEQSRANGESE